MITRYFTFGQGHRHELNGQVFDKDCVVKITAHNPAATMFGLFGAKWSHEYEHLEAVQVQYYRRGVIELKLTPAPQPKP